MKKTQIISIIWADKSKSSALLIGNTHIKISQKQMKLILTKNEFNIESTIIRENGRIETTYTLNY